MTPCVEQGRVARRGAVMEMRATETIVVVDGAMPSTAFIYEMRAGDTVSVVEFRYGGGDCAEQEPVVSMPEGWP